MKKYLVPFMLSCGLTLLVSCADCRVCSHATNGDEVVCKGNRWGAIPEFNETIEQLEDLGYTCKD